MRRAAVIGSPIEHSLSPVLHNAAYTALGLDWEYTRLECTEDRVAPLVASLGPEWAGLSCTMPTKRAALAVASSVTPRAAAVGAANTLVRTDSGWHADCTDVDGVVGALREKGFSSGTRGVVIGAGGTATAALAGLAELRISSVSLVVRDPSRAAEALETASRVGVAAEVLALSSVDLVSLAAGADVLVSTVPASATEVLADAVARAPYVLDVIYHPWPTPVALAVEAAGTRLATGLDMLLHQAFGQVEQFTGMPAPQDVMRSALAAELAARA
ncbi:shikimate dehydrogenase [Lentzea flava]|uniref:Shikimate dehydrogenase n=1 Tax=Lentzea flava TaxID=103732 RepID=A0ABQ2UJB5_9PSEU|nr:shikimate dehydrogenase [Lentzea flava]MCP2199208.1 shikimate dehydrogenase (EC 1.1.1.25) [Lentzea flava]GGU33767.1 shikimate dehydrogenase [Lentzea flava]